MVVLSVFVKWSAFNGPQWLWFDVFDTQFFFSRVFLSYIFSLFARIDKEKSSVWHTNSGQKDANRKKSRHRVLLDLTSNKYQVQLNITVVLRRMLNATIQNALLRAKSLGIAHKMQNEMPFEERQETIAKRIFFSFFFFD